MLQSPHFFLDHLCPLSLGDLGLAGILQEIIIIHMVHFPTFETLTPSALPVDGRAPLNKIKDGFIFYW